METLTRTLMWGQLYGFSILERRVRQESLWCLLSPPDTMRDTVLMLMRGAHRVRRGLTHNAGDSTANTPAINNEWYSMNHSYIYHSNVNIQHILAFAFCSVSIVCANKYLLPKKEKYFSLPYISQNEYSRFL